ncbi:MAG: JAB domain-containing protein [Jejuia sp.]
MKNNTISEIQLKYHSNRVGKFKIKSSSDAFKCLKSAWNLDTIELQEEFKMLLLNRANEVLGVHALSKGSMTGTLVDLRLLFAVVLKSAACSIIMCHNHPSGNLSPSEADKRLFRKITKAAELLDIQVLDNLIISKNGYLSFADEYIV